MTSSAATHKRNNARGAIFSNAVGAAPTNGMQYTSEQKIQAVPYNK